MINLSIRKPFLPFFVSIAVILVFWFFWIQNKTATITEDIPEVQEPIRYQSSTDITVEDLYHYISVLASDSLEGREAGTMGEKKSIDFICEKFSGYGLSCRLQPFTVIKSWIDGAFSFGNFNGELHRDFIPILPMDSCNISGEVVFIGDGYRYINNRKILNDFQGIDIRGKWVMIFEEERSTGLKTLKEKYNIVQNSGAIGVITVQQNPVSNGQLVNGGFAYFTGNHYIPIIRLSERTADSLFRYVDVNTAEVSGNLTEKQWNLQIPVKVNGSIHKRRKALISNNIIAYLEGNDSILKKEYIVVGAHYDHLGMKTFPTVIGDSTIIYYGADDNASGTAGVMELAEKLSSAGELKRSLIFILFGAEEQQPSLQGSHYFCENFPVSPEKIKLMINMDMIGRVDSLKQVYVHTDIPNSLLLKKINEVHSEVALNIDTKNLGKSDHRSFANKKVPIAYFTTGSTGSHEEYHTPKDNVNTINFEGEKKLLDLIYDFVILKNNQ